MGRPRGHPERHRCRADPAGAPVGDPAAGRDRTRKRLPDRRRLHQPARPRSHRVDVRGGSAAASRSGHGRGSPGELGERKKEGGSDVRSTQSRPAYVPAYGPARGPPALLSAAARSRPRRRASLPAGAAFSKTVNRRKPMWWGIGIGGFILYAIILVTLGVATLRKGHGWLF